MVNQQIFQQQQQGNFGFHPAGMGGPNIGPVDDLAKQRYLEEEKERLRQFEEQRQKQQVPGSTRNFLPKLFLSFSF